VRACVRVCVYTFSTGNMCSLPNIRGRKQFVVMKYRVTFLSGFVWCDVTLFHV